MTTNRNQLMPSGKRTPISANTEAVREYPARNRKWPERMIAIVVGEHPRESLTRFRGRWNSQLTVDAWGNCGQQMGNQELEFNRERLSVSKGTRETQPSRVIARIDRLAMVESSPM